MVSQRKLVTYLTVGLAVIPALYQVVLFLFLGLPLVIAAIFAEGFGGESMCLALVLIGGVGGTIGLMRAANWMADKATAILLIGGLFAIALMVFWVDFDADLSRMSFRKLILSADGKVNLRRIWFLWCPLVKNSD